ncbi:hypothetical protein BDV35DRAFT_397801 [Aspergillus flavus]|uniref:Uncharacterized protein n=1 Tax=Aspergillus flavus TaxID=5059 RepID=A0A5N6GJT1_ASPFL|nr:hypothetical protein BDV35DRAFT_397801 [Aspergillus flavus]
MTLACDTPYPLNHELAHTLLPGPYIPPINGLHVWLDTFQNSLSRREDPATGSAKRSRLPSLNYTEANIPAIADRTCMWHILVASSVLPAMTTLSVAHNGVNPWLSDDNEPPEDVDIIAAKLLPA